MNSIYRQTHHNVPTELPGDPMKTTGRRRQLFATAAAALITASLLAGCGTASNASGTSSEKPKIGVMIKDTTIPFFGRQIKGYEEAAAKYGMELTIYNGKSDNATQVGLIQQMTVKKVDMMMVTPGDPQAVNGALKQASTAGIPAVAVNTEPKDKSNILSFIGANDIEYGHALGQLVVAATGGTGKIAVVRGKLGDPADTLRRNGLEEELRKSPGIEIVAEQAANWDSAKALNVTQDFLNKYPKGELDAIVDVGPNTVSAAKYAHENNRSELKFVMGDFPSNVKQGIKDGYIYGTVNQDPYEQSAKAMELADKYFKGDKAAFPATQYLPLPLVTKENVDSYPAAW